MERNAQLSGRLHGNWIYHTETPGKMISHTGGPIITKGSSHFQENLEPGSLFFQRYGVPGPHFPGNMVHKAPIYGIPIFIWHIQLTNTVLSTVAILLLLDTDLLRQACFSYYTQLPDTTSLHSLQINKSIQAHFQSCYHHIQVSVRPHLN